MTALSSGHLFYELRLLVESCEISIALIHVCYLGNILVFSTVKPGLLCKGWKSILIVAIALN